MRSSFAVVALLLAFLAIQPLTAIAEESGNQIHVQNTSPEFVINNPENPQNTYTIDVVVEGPTPGILKVVFLDKLKNENGSEFFEAGLLPNSLVHAIELVPTNLSYVPDGSPKLFSLVFRPVLGIQEKIYSGIIRIGFEATENSSGVIASSIGVTKELVVTPFGGASKLTDVTLQPALIKNITITPLERSSWVDRLLPDIPGVVNFGPVRSTVTLENPGQYPVFVTYKWDFSSNGEALAKKETERELLAGGKTSTKAVETIISDQSVDRSLNLLPAFGLVELSFAATSDLTGVTLPAQTDSITFLILPWKEPVAILSGVFLIAVLMSRYGRSRRLERSTNLSE